MTHADNTSWVAAFIGKRTDADALSTHPGTSLTFVSGTDQTIASTTEVCAFDTNATVSSYTTNNVTLGTATGWFTTMVEVMENQPGTIQGNLVQHISFAYQDANASGETQDNYVWQFEPMLANNGVLFALQYQDAGHTPSISDDKGNTWGSADVTAGITGGGTVLALYHLSNANGISQIKVTFGGNPQNQVRAKITQLFNVTGTVEGTATSGVSGTAATGGVVSTTGYTPSAANSIIFTYIMPTGNTMTTNPALIVPDTNCTLNDGDISFGANGWADASSYTLQTSAVAYTPRMFLNAATVTDTFHIVSIALSTGSQGTQPATGAGQAPFVKKILHFGSNVSAPATVLCQIPSEGNGGVFTTFFADTGNPHLTSMKDNDGVTWTLTQPSGVSGTVLMPNRFNTSQRTNRTITATIGGTGQNVQLIFYDIANLATSGVIVAQTGTTGNSTGASITPTAANQLTIVYLQCGTGPTSDITAPSGAVYDLPTASTWVGTGSINGTTLTVSTTTWGTFNNGINTAILAGSGVTDGTCPTAGTGPTYTINPNNGVIALEALSLSTTDTNTMNWGNGAGHYYNVNSISAQAWNFTASQNTPGTPGGQFAAIILKGPAGVTAVAAGASQADLFVPQLGPGIGAKLSPKFGPALSYPAAVVTVTVTFTPSSTLPMMGVG